jgi:hypothetical protein
MRISGSGFRKLDIMLPGRSVADEGGAQLGWLWSNEIPTI